MSKRILFTLVLSLVPVIGLIAYTQLGAKDPEAKEAKKEEPAKAEAAATPVKPKPLSDNVKKGLSLPGQPAARGRRLGPGRRLAAGR